MTFTVVTTEEIDVTGSRVLMFGLAVPQGETFAAISPHKSQVEEMARILNSSGVAPEHQRDLLEDMVQQIYLP